MKPFIAKQIKAGGSIAFHVSGSNKELLEDIQGLMQEKGLVGIMDAAGRFHYIVDGRKGAPYATKRIEDLARILLRDSSEEDESIEKEAVIYVDAVIGCYAFDRTLRGYHLLRQLLIAALVDPSLKESLTKKLYPRAGEAFGLTGTQVERNIRYLLKQLAQDEKDIEEEAILRIQEDQGAYYQTPTRRKLFQNRDHYSNSEAIAELLYQIEQAIRRDRSDKEMFPGIDRNPILEKKDPRGTDRSFVCRTD